MRRFLVFALVALSFAVVGQSTTQAAQEPAKWFVLRNHQIGNCWTALLIRVDGQYINTFEQKAGGPYDTEEEALQRAKALQETGTCLSEQRGSP